MCGHRSLVGLCTLDYKSLCVAVMISATLVNIRTHRQTDSDLTSLYTVSQKNCAKLILPELCQTSTNFDTFLQKDGKEAKIMQDPLTFHLN